MSDFAVSEVQESPSAMISLAVADLEVGPSLREDGLCEDHLERLVATGGHWPPILVSRADNVVIDGAHRVAAAQQLGLLRIDAVMFDGSPEAAFLEFVRRNVTHGLLLTVAERKGAALRVLRAHRDWSDRRIAAVCGLSPKTVGSLRPKSHPNAETPQPDERSRIGLDNRRRPVDRSSARSRVVEALRAQPQASLRAIAAVTGVSPETVRSVRKSLEAEAEAPARPAPVVPLPVPEPQPDQWWQSDAALDSCEQGEDFLEWFERTALAEPDVSWADAVPMGRVYQVADEARRRSESWSRFARICEARAASNTKH